MTILNIKKIKIDILQNSDIIECTVELVPRSRFYKEKVAVCTQDVYNHLISQGHRIHRTQYVKKINNYKNGVPHKATWSFEIDKPVVAQAASKKTPTSAKKRPAKSRVSKKTKAIKE